MENQQLLKALEADKDGNWDLAHQIVQSYNSKDACWIHAYLHRKEGDIGNAKYWYSRAGKIIPNCSLAEEWKIIYKDINN